MFFYLYIQKTREKTEEEICEKTQSVIDEEISTSPHSPVSIASAIPTTSASTSHRKLIERAKFEKKMAQTHVEKAIQELREISNKLERRNEDNEFDCFGKSIASQLKQLPEPVALKSISYIQSYLVQQRLKCYNQPFSTKHK